MITKKEKTKLKTVVVSFANLDDYDREIDKLSQYTEVQLALAEGKGIGWQRALNLALFAIEEKPGISNELFAYCLKDFWTNEHPGDHTISFGAVAVGEGSPGQIFKLPEASVRHYLDQIKQATNGAIAFQESASLQQVIKSGKTDAFDFLENIYISA